MLLLQLHVWLKDKCIGTILKQQIIAIPILDTLISEMKFCFNKFSITASKVLYLVPELMRSESDIVAKLSPVIEM